MPALFTYDDSEAISRDLAHEYQFCEEGEQATNTF